MPEEYLDFLMMTEIYHCTPEEYDRIDEATVIMHKNFLRIREEQSEIDVKRAAQRRRLKS